MGFNLADYEPVEDRLARFWEENPKGRVFTDLINQSETQYIIKAYLFKVADDAAPWATGYAEETVSTRGVNQTSALENCETSAIGRALANAGYAPKGKRPSREEMSKVVRKTPELSPTHQALKVALAKKFKEASERKTWVESVVFHDISGISALTEDEVKLCNDQLALEEAK
jgi:hypothetical protein